MSTGVSVGVGAGSGSGSGAAEAITLALTGASGSPYALRLLECLLTGGERVNLIVSDAARLVLASESDLTLPAKPSEQVRILRERLGTTQGELRAYALRDWMAPMASGSNPGRAMVICPCTMGSLGAIASGTADNLIHRAADVCLKEGKRLILVPRETPYSAIHLENMLRLARAGAVILPPDPGFYHRPETLQDLVDFVVARILDRLEVPHQLMQRWGDAG